MRHFGVQHAVSEYPFAERVVEEDFSPACHLKGKCQDMR